MANRALQATETRSIQYLGRGKTYLQSYTQYVPTMADGLQYLVVEQYKTAKPISDSSIILFLLLK